MTSLVRRIGRVVASPLIPAARSGARLLFIARGKRPWSFGYAEYKRDLLVEVLDRDDFDPSSLPSGFGHRVDERIVEYPWFFSRLPPRAGLLLDAGSVLNFDYVLEHPRLRNKQITIATLAPESHCYWDRGISYVFDDLRRCGFRDALFDWVVCLSTLEHIGLDNTRLYTDDRTKKEQDEQAHLEAVRELARVLRPGGVLFASVPFGVRENGGWYQIFDGDMVDRVVAAFGPAHVDERYFRYEPDGWVASDRAACRDARYFDIHQHPDFDPDYAAASRAVVCLELEKRC